MNERIRELYIQAMEQKVSNNMAWEELNPEKFAQLIVRECVAICNNANGASYLNGVYAGRQIKQHFGVEE